MDRHPQPSALPPWWLMLGLAGAALTFAGAWLSGGLVGRIGGAIALVVFLVLLVRDRQTRRRIARESR